MACLIPSGQELRHELVADSASARTLDVASFTAFERLENARSRGQTECMNRTLERLADSHMLGALLDLLGSYELVDHWQQGEFHHDVVLRVRTGRLEGLAEARILVVATNCNGGVKEVLAFAEVPTSDALWHWRCPEAPEFQGELPPVLGRATTTHWFPPCDLLAADARSELREEFRERQPGGGFRMKG